MSEERGYMNESFEHFIDRIPIKKINQIIIALKQYIGKPGTSKDQIDFSIDKLKYCYRKLFKKFKKGDFINV